MKIFKTIDKISQIKTRFQNKKITTKDCDWLKDTIQEMGPTYVKIGQFVSNRSDIFHNNIIKSLRELQDNVEPIKYDYVRNLIQTEYPNKNGLIDKISIKPIASASISQVHKAYSKDYKPYAVKIKRPDIDKEINDDIDSLLAVLKLMKISKMDNIDETIILVEDIKNVILEETNFKKEVEKIKLFNNFMKDNPNVLLPTPYESVSTDNIIIMSFVDSTRLSDLNMSSDKKKKIAYELMDLFLYQLIKHGIVHGDPHEGNICYNVEQDKFVFYDLGNILLIDEQFRSQIKLFIYYLYFENIEESVNILKRIKYITINDEGMLEIYLRKYSKYIKTVDISVMNLDSSLLQSMPIKFDITLLQLIRVFGLIEGICKGLDPEFNYTEIFMKYILSDTLFIEKKVSDDIKVILEFLISNLK